MICDARISECGLYRYTLTRRWADGPTCVFVMLNPSTADANKDDPTIRRCIHFAKREGCGALHVVNLYAFRATKPADMVNAVDPEGPMARKYLIDAAEMARDSGGPVIAAWGAHWMAADRGKEVRGIIGAMQCLGTTKAGHPRHPLYVQGVQPLEDWPAGEDDA
jgi:hypothetical protein